MTDELSAELVERCRAAVARADPNGTQFRPYDWVIEAILREARAALATEPANGKASEICTDYSKSAFKAMWDAEYAHALKDKQP